MRRGILSAGTWCVDLNKTLAAWPKEDTATRIDVLEKQGGGAGCNLACAVKRLDPDLPVEAMGLVGEDDDGRFLLGVCDALNIGRAGMKTSARAATHFADCFNSKASGLRTHVYYGGVADLLTPEDFDFSGSNARYLHLGMPGAHRAMDAPSGGESSGWIVVLKAAQAHGLKTNLELVTSDRERMGALGRSCLPHLNCLIVNDFEIGAVADIETRKDDRADPAAIARAVQIAVRLGPLDVVVAHFPEGAIAATRDGAIVACGSVAIPAAEIAGVNGAGDCFAAGMLYGLHEGWDPQACLTLANAAAAQSMREVPTTTGVRSFKECLEGAARWGYRPAPI